VAASFFVGAPEVEGGTGRHSPTRCGFPGWLSPEDHGDLSKITPTFIYKFI
jgi:hypothetical protein